LPLVAAFCYALTQILTRTLGNTENASTMATYIQACFVVVSSAFGLTVGDGALAGPDAGPQMVFLLRAWVWPNVTDAAIMLGLGVLSATGGYLISQGYRLSEAGLVAPFEYTALPLAVFWSVLLWGDWPDATAWVGIALICGAGLYVFYRESALGQKIALRRPMPRNQ
jgi:drug/metabolite transporter (DMT)-like permease